jgi:hypothetical protein
MDRLMGVDGGDGGQESRDGHNAHHLAIAFHDEVVVSSLDGTVQGNGVSFG